jgi:hypothetical protein
MKWRKRGCDDEEGVMMVTAISPEQTRAQDEQFVSQCSLAGLRERYP